MNDENKKEKRLKRMSTFTRVQRRVQKSIQKKHSPDRTNTIKLARRESIVSPKANQLTIAVQDRVNYASTMTATTMRFTQYSQYDNPEANFNNNLRGSSRNWVTPNHKRGKFSTIGTAEKKSNLKIIHSKSLNNSPTSMLSPNYSTAESMFVVPESIKMIKRNLGNLCVQLDLSDDERTIDEKDIGVP